MYKTNYMSNRKNLIKFTITGKNYYNEPHIRTGVIEYDKIVIAKKLLKQILINNSWGKDIIYSGLYIYKDLIDEQSNKIIWEMTNGYFILIDKIEFVKNTKILNIDYI